MIQAKEKGLPDGSNMHLIQQTPTSILVFREKDHDVLWAATTSSLTIANYLYDFEKNLE